MRYKSPSRSGWPIMSDAVSASGRPHPTLLPRLGRPALAAVLSLIALLLLPGSLGAPVHVASSDLAAPLPTLASPASPFAHGHAADVLSGTFAHSVGVGPSSPFAFLPARAGGLSSLARALPLSGGTANTLVANSSCGENAGLVTAGTSGNVLLGSAFSLLSLFNGTGGVPCNTAAISGFFYTHGTSSFFRSTDGGSTWSSGGIPGNVTHWQNSSDPAYGSISWSGWLLNTLQPSPIIESPSLSAAGNFALYATTYAPSCFLTGGTCNSTKGLYGPVGIGVSASTDAGASWSSQAQISAQPEVQYLVPAPACQTIGWTTGPYFGNITEMPAAVASPASGHGVVAWDVVGLWWQNSTCSFNILVTVYESHTSNFGATWSTPRAISNNASEYPWATVGPAPSYPITVSFSDFFNGTNTTSAIGFVQSTDNGTTWSVEKDTGGGSELHYASRSVSPDTFQAQTNARIAADNWTGSAYSGYLYAAWTDNQTGSLTGRPAIDFQHSGNGGSSWTPAISIANGSSSTTYYDPTVAVQPDGTVWVTFMAIDQSTGDVQEEGVLSTNGGATFTQPFPMASASGAPGSQLAQLTAYNGITGIPQGAAALWSDCRGGICTSNFAPALYFGTFGSLTVTTNRPVNASISVSTLGQTLNLGAPILTGAAYNAPVTVTVPSYFAVNATYVATFVNFSGVASGTNPSITFTYAGPGTLVANYAVALAGFVAGTFTPNVPSSALNIGGFPVVLQTLNATTLHYNVTVPSGSTFTATASAQKYVSRTYSVSAPAGQTHTLNIQLNRTGGWVAGRLQTNPANGTATLLLNGTTVASATGTFNVSVPWGSYWLNATGAGLTGYSHYTTVNPGQTTQLTITLSGGLIEGVVTPVHAGLRVTVDGANVTNVTSGTFFYPAFGGSHTVAATQTGYNLTVLSVLVTPGASSFVNLSLTNLGSVTGIISPADVLSIVHVLIVNGTHGGYASVSTSTGVFNKTSLAAGYNYTINVSAAGYNSVETHAVVTAGNTTAVGTITLTKTACTSNCSPPQNNSTGPSNSGIPLTTLIIVVVVVALAAVIAAVLLMRRRGGGSAPDASETPAATQEELYGGGGQVPRMRPDGSMDSGSPPTPPSS